MKGKEYKVGSHWCHFKGVSAEQVASCESRVNGYTEKDRQRIAAKARGQRLKLLQRWFWAIARSNAPEPGEAGFEDLAYYLGAPQHRHVSFSVAEIDHTAKVIKTYVDELTHQEIWEIASGSPPGRAGYSLWDEDFINLPNIAVTEINKKITVEVLGYLSSKPSRATLKDIYESVATALDCYARMAGLEGGERDEYASAHFEGLLFWLFHIPWAAEFQRLEAESQKQKAD